MRAQPGRCGCFALKSHLIIFFEGHICRYVCGLFLFYIYQQRFENPLLHQTKASSLHVRIQSNHDKSGSAVFKNVPIREMEYIPTIEKLGCVNCLTYFPFISVLLTTASNHLPFTSSAFFSSVLHPDRFAIRCSLFV